MVLLHIQYINFILTPPISLSEIALSWVASFSFLEPQHWCLDGNIILLQI